MLDINESLNYVSYKKKRSIILSTYVIAIRLLYVPTDVMFQYNYTT